jgi:hypothetical protein
VRNFKCSNCAQPLRAQSLPGHYGATVDIDMCDDCCLIWFDEVESVRISKHGIAELVKVVHAAMSGGALHAGAASLAATQHCPVCVSPLRQVFNASRYGRTSQCPQGHGYYQSYILYLAEKGYVRPINWKDISSLLREAKELFCGNCGGGLALRPQDECPYCRSDIAVLDPGRLAAAVGADPSDLAARPKQLACHACGSPVDPTRDTSCQQCHAVLRPDTRAAVDAVSKSRKTFTRPARAAAIPVSPEQLAERRVWLPFGLDGVGRRLALAAAMLLVLTIVRYCG